VSLDNIGLLVGLSLLLGLAKLLDETHGTALQATVDPSTLSSWEHGCEILAGHVEESVEGKGSVWACSYGFHRSGGGNILVKVDSTVRELSERSLSLELGSLLGILSRYIR
jgi:hypothetical protein